MESLQPLTVRITNRVDWQPRAQGGAADWHRNCTCRRKFADSQEEGPMLSCVFRSFYICRVCPWIWKEGRTQFQERIKYTTSLRRMGIG